MNRTITNYSNQKRVKKTKRWLQYLTLGLLMTFGLNASAQVQVGEGNITGQASPFNPYYGFSYSQNIYLSSEIDASGQITSISWYFYGTGSLQYSDEITVYLKHTTKTQFTSTSDWENMTESDEVFSGTITTNSEIGWKTIQLDTPFNYNGTDNLIVAVHEGNHPGEYDNSTDRFYNHNANSNRALTFYTDDEEDNPNPLTSIGAGNLSQNIANVIFGGISQSCSKPTNIISTINSMSSASFQWAQVNQATTYSWELRTSGNAESGSEGLVSSGTATTNSITIDDLEIDINYTFYVKSNCDTELISDWTSGNIIKLGYCNPVYSSGCSFGAKINAVTTTDALININNSDTGCSTDSFGNYASDTSNQLTIAEGTEFNINVNIISYSAGVKIWIDANSNGVFENSEIVAQSQNTISANSDFSQTISSNPNLISGNSYRMRIRAVESNTSFDACSSYSFGEAEDYTINVVDAPDCPPVTGITRTTNSLSSVTFNWNENEIAEDFTWEIRTAGNPGSGSEGLITSGTAITNSVTINDLDIDVNYIFYVRANCQTDSTLYSSNSFILGYCTPLYTWGCGNGARINNVITSDAITNISNVNTGCSTNSYINYSNNSNLQISAVEASIFNIAVTITEYSAGVKIWIDSNKNGVFEESEIVSQSTDTIEDGETFNSQINLPASLIEGESYRMRIRAVEGSTTFDACSSNNYGETEDYTINIIEAPSCMPVTGLTVEAISLSSAEFSWNEVSNATTYAWELRTAGLPESGATDLVNSGIAESTSVTIENLLIDTNYYFYVKSVCSDTDSSLWTNNTIKLGYCIPIFTYGCTSGAKINDFVVFDPITLDILYAKQNTGCSTNSYANYSIDPADHLSFPANSTLNTSVKIMDYYAGVKIWIDINQNGIFDENELVAESASTIPAEESFNSTITLPSSLVAGESYRLRIKAVEGDTMFEACSTNGYGEVEDYTINITENTNSVIDVDNFTLKAFPNPVNDLLNITSNTEINSVQVVNVLGQIIKTVNTNGNEISVNLTDLASGNYLVKITSDNNHKTIKIVKK